MHIYSILTLLYLPYHKSYNIIYLHIDIFIYKLIIKIEYKITTIEFNHQITNQANK
jgi:hypothetical protein